MRSHGSSLLGVQPMVGVVELRRGGEGSREGTEGAKKRGGKGRGHAKARRREEEGEGVEKGVIPEVGGGRCVWCGEAR